MPQHSTAQPGQTAAPVAGAPASTGYTAQSPKGHGLTGTLEEAVGIVFSSNTLKTKGLQKQQEAIGLRLAAVERAEGGGVHGLWFPLPQSARSLIVLRECHQVVSPTMPEVNLASTHPARQARDLEPTTTQAVVEMHLEVSKICCRS
jgi:hypothetical protein